MAAAKNAHLHLCLRRRARKPQFATQQPVRDHEGKRHGVPDRNKGIDEKDCTIESEGCRNAASCDDVERDQSQAICDLGMRKLLRKHAATA
eukprot:gene63713-87134_t